MMTIDEQVFGPLRNREAVRKHDPADPASAQALRKTAEGLLHIWLNEYQTKHSVSLSKAYDAAMKDVRARAWWDQCRAADAAIAKTAGEQQAQSPSVLAPPARRQTSGPDSMSQDEERHRAGQKFGAMVDQLQRDHKCTRSQAQDMALRTKEGRQAFADFNKASPDPGEGGGSWQAPSRRASDRASDITDDVRSKLARRFDASAKFNAAVIALQQAIPGLSRSRASDRVRIEQPQLWEAMSA
jgi:hypothetical protein